MLRPLLPTLRPLATPSRARCISTVRAVPPSGDRHLALPLAFLTVQGWSSDSPERWQAWTARFASRGYSSLLLNIDPADVKPRDGSPTALLDALEQELVRLLQSPEHSSPFPPLLFAHSASSLLAETYVSSHPLSGLCLVSPLSAPAAHTALPAVFSTPLDEFNYEPGFPIAVVREEGDAEEHRLLTEFVEENEEDSVVRQLRGRRDNEGWEKVQEWMDENGL